MPFCPRLLPGPKPLIKTGLGPIDPDTPGSFSKIWLPKPWKYYIGHNPPSQSPEPLPTPHIKKRIGSWKPLLVSPWGLTGLRYAYTRSTLTLNYINYYALWEVSWWAQKQNKKALPFPFMCVFNRLLALGLQNVSTTVITFVLIRSRGVGCLRV